MGSLANKTLKIALILLLAGVPLLMALTILLFRLFTGQSFLATYFHIDPMPRIIALALILCSLALVALTFHRKKAAIFLGAFIVLLGVVCFVLMGTGWVDFFSEVGSIENVRLYIACMVGCCLLGFSSGYYAMHDEEFNHYSSPAMLNLAGSLVVALAIGVAVDDFLASITYAVLPWYSHMPMHALLALGLLGVGFILCSIWRGEGKPQSEYWWYPVQAGAILAVATFVLWEGALRGEQEHLTHGHKNLQWSAKPVAILIFGTLITCLGAISLYFAQRSKHRQHELEEAILTLKQTMERNRLVLSCMGEGIFGVDTEGKVTFINKAALQMLGFTEQECIGTHLREKIEVSNPTNSRVRVVNERHIEVSDEWYRRKDDTLFPVVYTCSILGEESDVEGAVIVFRDITERRRYERSLQEAQMIAENANIAKSAFLANMSHEIRTPLNGVIGMTSLLESTDLNAKQKKYVSRIAVSGKILLELINDILDLSKIEAGQMTVEMIEFNLLNLIKETVHLFTARVEEKGIELVVQISPGLRPDVIGDPSRIRQIVNNLLSNAVKFTHQGSILVKIDNLQIDPEHQEINITVTDTGIGIPKEKQAELFQKFLQGDNSTTRKYGGSGLGLSISRQLVLLLGGDLIFESIDGLGSSFTAVIPLVCAKEALMNPPVEFKGLRVLVVEDVNVSREMLQKLLSQWQCDYHVCGGASECLKYLEARSNSPDRPNVVLIDYSLEEMNGLELGKVIKQIDTKAIVLMLLTAHDVSKQEAEAHGFTGIISKPIFSDELAQVMRTALGFTPAKV